MQKANVEFLILSTSPDALEDALIAAEAVLEGAEGEAEYEAQVRVESLTAQAKDLATRDEPIRTAIRDAIEVGVVVPSILRTNLAKAKLTLVDDTASLAEYGFASLATLKRVIVADKGTIVAMGAAGDPDEAILAAMLGWVREHPLEGSVVPAGMGTAPSAPATASPN
jgi:hypothetical protein